MKKFIIAFIVFVFPAQLIGGVGDSLGGLTIGGIFNFNQLGIDQITSSKDISIAGLNGKLYVDSCGNSIDRITFSVASTSMIELSDSQFLFSTTPKATISDAFDVLFNSLLKLNWNIKYQMTKQQILDQKLRTGMTPVKGYALEKEGHTRKLYITCAYWGGQESTGDAVVDLLVQASLPTACMVSLVASTWKACTDGL